MATLELQLRNGKTETTHPDQQDADADVLLQEFTNRQGAFSGEWVQVKPGDRFVRYEEVVAVGLLRQQRRAPTS